MAEGCAICGEPATEWEDPLGTDVPLCMDCKMDREEEAMQLAKVSVEIRRVVVVGFEMEGPSRELLIDQADEIFRDGLSVEQIRELPAVVGCTTWEGDDADSEIAYWDADGESLGRNDR